MKVLRICAALLVWFGAPASSRADDTGAGTSVAYGIAGAAAGIFDVGFTAYDLTHLSSVDTIPRALGLVELAGALPQVAVASYVAANAPPANGVRGLSVAWALWASLLSAHGIWVLASGKKADAGSLPAPEDALAKYLDLSMRRPQGSGQRLTWSMVRRF
jgi:hypothetical protein